MAILAQTPLPLPPSEGVWMHNVNLLLMGAIMLASAVIALIFVKFWRRTRDGLFLAFALAFGLMMLSFLARAMIPPGEDTTLVYVLRLATYGMILVGVAVKNRSGRRP